MASFTGTDKEFHRFIGPCLRNQIQSMTMKYKKKIGQCEQCHKKENLESAHVHGKERITIINTILKNYIKDDLVSLDLDGFKNEFKLAHEPIEKAILVLCKSCHRKYDSVNTLSEEQLDSVKKNSCFVDEHQSDAILKIQLEPRNITLFKAQLLRSKRAEITTVYNDESISSKLWKANSFKNTSDVMGNLRSRPDFRAKNWQANNIKSVNVKILN